jgi:Ca-activated chloride channel family protein
MYTDRSRSFLTASLAFLLHTALWAQGVMIHDASTGSLLAITASHVQVAVEDQIAVVTSTQRFQNTTPDALAVKYAYPLAATASATRIRWMTTDSLWHTASMVAEPQDTTLPGVGSGGSVAAALASYLGGSPLYFNMDQPVAPGGWVSVELTYVQLLPYGNARVELISASDYSEVLNGTIPEVSVEASVRSQRAILGIDLSGTGSWAPLPDAPYLAADSAHMQASGTDVPASCGFAIGYDLDPLAYGITCLSNFLPDTLVKCDQMPNGFFVLLIEPEPTSEVVAKDFVIVIDHSGSMSGTKMDEAKDAAEFMVEHLNPGDAFNVIAFDDDNIRWSTGLEPYNAANMTAALDWIGQVQADGSTNINGAVSEGIQNFSTSTMGHARSLVFLTDGQDNTTSTETILSTAQQLRQDIAPDLQLFTFGIGEGFNEQLLNQLAVQNNGVSQFLEAANFSQVMADFYTQIQNPVVLEPVATFDHPDVMDLYPTPLTGLFVGQQMVITGRYALPGPTGLHLEGTDPGGPVSFDYTFDLSGSFDTSKLFIPKIWAQYAVQALVNEYYGYEENSPTAIMLQDSIVNFSMCYGIGSPFTSFDQGGGGTVEVEEARAQGRSVPHYPEPSLVGSPVQFNLAALGGAGHVMIQIFDPAGRMMLERDISAWAGRTWIWDGKDAEGNALSGVLLYRIDDGQRMWSGRLTRT